jgi:hypothetical protein
MAVGYIASVANAELDALVAAYPYVKLHVGDPGAAGTSNPAGNTTRKLVTWGAASGGVVSNSADVDWSDAEVTTAEDYTHFSLWTASSAGSCGFTGTVTANAVSATGDSFTIPTGDFDVSLNVAA